MSRLKDLTNQVPSFACSDDIHNQIYQAQANSLEQLDEKTLETFNQLFIDSATSGLRKWEEFLDIKTDLTKNVVERRLEIKNNLQLNQTVTREFLKNIFIRYGYSNPIIEENLAPYIINVTINQLANENTADEMMDFLREVFPAHLNGVISFNDANTVVTWLSEKVNTNNTVLVDFYSPTTIENKLLLEKNGINPKGTLINIFKTDITKNAEITEVEADIEPGYKIFYGAPQASGSPLDATWGRCVSNSNFFTSKLYGIDDIYYTSPSMLNKQTAIVICENTATANYAEWIFEGTGVELAAIKANCYGIAQITIDDTIVNEVDLYDYSNIFEKCVFYKTSDSSSTADTTTNNELLRLARKSVFSIEGLSPGIHKIRITPTGRKNAYSSSSKINFTGIFYQPYRLRWSDGHPCHLVTDTTHAYDTNNTKFKLGSNAEQFINLKGYKNLRIYGKATPNSTQVYFNFSSCGSVGFSNIYYRGNTMLDSVYSYKYAYLSNSWGDVYPHLVSRGKIQAGNEEVLLCGPGSLTMVNYNTGVVRFSVNYKKALSSINWVTTTISQLGSRKYSDSAWLIDYAEDRVNNNYLLAIKEIGKISIVKMDDTGKFTAIQTFYNQTFISSYPVKDSLHMGMTTSIDDNNVFVFNKNNNKIYFKTYEGEVDNITSMNTYMLDTNTFTSTSTIECLKHYTNRIQESDANVIINRWEKFMNNILDTKKGSASSTPEAQIRINFYGNTLGINCLKGPHYGKLKITVDDSMSIIVDNYNPTVTTAQVYSTSFPETSSMHSVTLEVTGEKNPSSTGYLQTFDYITVNEPNYAYTIDSQTSTPNGYTRPFLSFLTGVCKEYVYCLERLRNKYYLAQYDGDMYLIKRVEIAGPIDILLDDYLGDVKLISNHGMLCFSRYDKSLNLLKEVETTDWIYQGYRMLLGNGKIIAVKNTPTEEDTLIALYDENFNKVYEKRLANGDKRYNIHSMFVSNYGNFHFNNKTIGGFSRYTVFDN